MAQQIVRDTLVTGEMLAEMGSELSELVEGKIVKMSPAGWRHGKFEFRFGSVLGEYVGNHHLGEVLVGEVGIYTQRNPDTVRGADVAFISYERLAAVRSPSFLDQPPELVVEILSPDDRPGEVDRKIQEYLAAGIERVWLVDPSKKNVSIYRSLTKVQILTERDELADDLLPGFHVAIADLLAD